MRTPGQSTSGLKEALLSASSSTAGQIGSYLACHCTKGTGRPRINLRWRLCWMDWTRSSRRFHPRWGCVLGLWIWDPLRLPHPLSWAVEPGEAESLDPSVSSWYLSLTLQSTVVTSLSFPSASQGGGTKKQNIDLEQKLYDGVSATSTWLDDVEERLFVATALVPEETETCIFNQEVSLAACVCEGTSQSTWNADIE